MNMIPFICLLVVCATLGILNTIFYKQSGWKGIAVRGLTIFAVLTFAAIVANLRGISNALPLFLILGLALLLLAETVYVSMADDDKFKPIVNGGFFAAANVLFALCAMSLAEFSLFPLIGGVLAGIGFGLISCVQKRNKGLNRILMNILSFAGIGLLLGVSVNAVLSSKHMISSICMLAGGGLMLIHRLLVVCGHGKLAGYLERACLSLGLIALSISLYFY